MKFADYISSLKGVIDQIAPDFNTADVRIINSHNRGFVPNDDSEWNGAIKSEEPIRYPAHPYRALLLNRTGRVLATVYLPTFQAEARLRNAFRTATPWNRVQLRPKTQA